MSEMSRGARDARMDWGSDAIFKFVHCVSKFHDLEAGREEVGCVRRISAAFARARGWYGVCRRALAEPRRVRSWKRCGRGVASRC